MVPRGGYCTSCRKYILWGDIVRGSYRRGAGGVIPQSADEQDEANTFESDLEGRPSVPDRSSTSKAGRSRPGQKSSKASNEGHFSKPNQNLEEHPTFQPSSETHRIKATSTSKPRKLRQKKAIAGDESSGESFDFHSQSSNGSTSWPLKKTRGRPRKGAVLTSTPPESCQENTIIGMDESSGESFDLHSECSTEMTSQKSRPRKSVTLTSMPRKSRQKKATVAEEEGSGEWSDFDSECSTKLTSQPFKKARGRPRKYLDSSPVPKKPAAGRSYSSTALSISDKYGDFPDLNEISDLEAAADEPAAPAQRSGNVVRLPTCDKQLVSTTGLTRRMGGLSIGSSRRSTRKPLVDVVEVIEVSD
jgi:structure-specific endonuclease subunit SLX1